MSSVDSIAQIIHNSGNNFHAKVARWFTSNQWHTVVSPYYMDQSQAKAREIDLIVEKLWPIKNTFGLHEGDVVVRLFVECKFLASETVFWFAPKNRKAATELVCNATDLHETNSLTPQHHYLAESPRVAKLFASNPSKSPENDPIFRAVNQALNGTIAMRGQAPTHPDMQDRNSGISVVMEFPVVVCHSFSQVYEVDFLKESDPGLVEANFQLEVQYAFLDRSGNQRDEYFLLDFVEYEKLDKFWAIVSKDAQIAAKAAQQRR